MYRHFHWGLSVIAICLLAAGCKKDLLYWQHVQQLNTHTTSRLDNIRFLGNNICVIAGGVQFSTAEVLRSADGGYTWQNHAYPQAGKEMTGMSVTSLGHIYLCGADGTVLYSADSGLSFGFNRIGSWATLTGGTFATPDTGIFVSTVLQRNSAITRIDSAYHIINTDSFDFGMNNMYMADMNNGYIVGYGAVMKTVNRGNSWMFLDPTDDNFTAMDIHGDEIWMCGANGSVYHTINAGYHWDRYRNGNDIALPRYGLRCILFKDELNGWAAGDGGVMIHSNDGGKHWAQYSSFTGSTIRSMALCPNGDLLAAGDDGTLFRLSGL